MVKQRADKIIDRGWNHSSVWQGPHLMEQRSFAQRNEALLDDVPVMLSTVLGLEILLNEPYIDLRAASDLVLSDVGATIQVLRLIETGYEFDEKRPPRMGDCLASLDAATWFRAVSARTFISDQQHTETTALWKHCRLVAEYAELVSEWLECVSPEEAYLVGLLHGIGAIPAVLGWPNSDTGGLLEMEDALPLFVFNAMRNVNDSGLDSDWRFILTAADELAGPRQFPVGTSIDERTATSVNAC
jgi:hypothetical protein